MTARTIESVPLAGVAPLRPAYGNLKDEAARFIRAAIVSGRLAPDSKVDQDDVAESLGISRAPVREALIELAQKGFVVAVPRRGAFVAELTAEDIEDHYEIVASVFGLTTRRAVEKLLPAEVDELRRLHREIGSIEDTARRMELDRRFFNVIASAGRSPRLDAVLEFLGGVFQGERLLRVTAVGGQRAQVPPAAAERHQVRRRGGGCEDQRGVPARLRPDDDRLPAVARLPGRLLQSPALRPGAAEQGRR